MIDSDGAKAPGFDDRKHPCIELILGCLRSPNPGSFRASPNLSFKTESTIIYPWEKRKVRAITMAERPSQVQRDYGRIIRGIGTPAPIPKTRGKSPGRQLGAKGGQRPTHALIRRSKQDEFIAHSLPENSSIKNKRKSPAKRNRIPYTRVRRFWAKNRPAPMRC